MWVFDLAKLDAEQLVAQCEGELAGTAVGDVAFVLAPGGEDVPAALDLPEEGIPLPDRI